MGLSQAEFDRLVSDHGGALFRMAYRMVGDRHEAEDIVQDAYRSAWKSRKAYDATRGERAWLASILRRRVVDRWRKRPRPTVVGGESSFDVGFEPRDPLQDSYTDEMQHALDHLSPELRESLLLVVVGELTHQEVADMLQAPLGTVLSRVSRARERLREFLLREAKQTTR